MDWTNDQQEHLAGRELWLIKVGSCLQESDPLRLAVKKVISATQVKMNSFSFSGVALSEKESVLELPDPDCNYLVEFRLYEVDGLWYKSAIARSLRPGLAGSFLSILRTVSDVFRSLDGPSLFESDEEGSLVVEQLLLQANAKLEFTGQVLLLRNSGIDDLDSKTEFMLYDVVKSDFARDDSTKKCANKSLP